MRWSFTEGDMGRSEEDRFRHRDRIIVGVTMMMIVVRSCLREGDLRRSEEEFE